MFECILDDLRSVFTNSEILFSFTRKNQVVRPHAAYSRGTGGRPPTPPAPGKFFNDQTLNDQTLNDQTCE